MREIEKYGKFSIWDDIKIVCCLLGTGVVCGMLIFLSYYAIDGIVENYYFELFAAIVTMPIFIIFLVYFIFNLRLIFALKRENDCFSQMIIQGLDSQISEEYPTSYLINFFPSFGLSRIYKWNGNTFSFTYKGRKFYLTHYIGDFFPSLQSENPLKKIKRTICISPDLKINKQFNWGFNSNFSRFSDYKIVRLIRKRQKIEKRPLSRWMQMISTDAPDKPETASYQIKLPDLYIESNSGIEKMIFISNSRFKEIKNIDEIIDDIKFYLDYFFISK